MDDVTNIAYNGGGGGGSKILKKMRTYFMNGPYLIGVLRHGSAAMNTSCRGWFSLNISYSEENLLKIEEFLEII